MKAGQSRAGPVYQINTSVACTAIALHRPSTNQQFVAAGRRASDTPGRSFSTLHSLSPLTATADISISCSSPGPAAPQSI